MSHQDYKAALDTAQQELADLLKRQQEIEQEILRRRRTISSLIELIREGAVESQRKEKIKREIVEAWTRFNQDQSITEDIRKIIRAAGKKGVPKEALRGELSKLGNSIEGHSNPSGTVNAVVKRLIDQGEVVESPGLTTPKTVTWKKS
jgi:hypothetical protein